MYDIVECEMYVVRRSAACLLKSGGTLYSFVIGQLYTAAAYVAHNSSSFNYLTPMWGATSSLSLGCQLTIVDLYQICMGCVH